LWDLNEWELRTKVKDQTGPVARDFPTLVRLRLSFWEEYERAAREMVPMQLTNLYRGVCRNDVYWKLFEKYPALLPWVVCPLAGFLLQRKELEFLAEERMVEVLSVSPVKDDGKVDSRLAKVQLELYQTLQDRIYGSAIQKMESQQKNVNVNVNSNQTHEEAKATISLITNMDELDRRIKAIQEKRLALQTIAQPLEVNTQKLMRPDEVDTNQE
jgi:hypothetical protein